MSGAIFISDDLVETFTVDVFEPLCRLYFGCGERASLWLYHNEEGWQYPGHHQGVVAGAVT